MLHGLLVISSWNHQWSTVLPRVLCAISSGPNQPHVLRCKVALTWSHPTIVKFVKSKLGTKRVRKVVKMHSNEMVSLKY